MTTDISFIKILLIFYLLVAGNFTGNLMGKQLKQYLEENRIAQHIIAYITMLVLVIVGGNVTNTKKALVYSILGYIGFIFTTKMDIQWNLILLISLTIAFLYENSLKEKEKQANNDPVLMEQEKVKIFEKNDKLIYYTTFAILIISLLGMYLYINKKQVQYGGEFSLYNFFIK